MFVAFVGTQEFLLHFPICFQHRQKEDWNAMLSLILQMGGGEKANGTCRLERFSSVVAVPLRWKVKGRKEKDRVNNTKISFSNFKVSAGVGNKSKVFLVFLLFLWGYPLPVYVTVQTVIRCSTTPNHSHTHTQTASLLFPMRRNYLKVLVARSSWPFFLLHAK